MTNLTRKFLFEWEVGSIPTNTQFLDHHWCSACSQSALHFPPLILMRCQRLVAPVAAYWGPLPHASILNAFGTLRSRHSSRIPCILLFCCTCILLFYCNSSLENHVLHF